MQIFASEVKLSARRTIVIITPYNLSEEICCTNNKNCVIKKYELEESQEEVREENGIKQFTENYVRE